MFLKQFFYIFLMLQMAWAHYAFPITNAAMEVKVENTAGKIHYRPIQSYPRYQIVTPTKTHHLRPSSADSVAATSITLPPPTIDITTGNTVYTPAEFPHDLLEIAKHKLGLRSLDEVPSISELAEFLGTNTADETINYIRHLTSTDQGIALIKAYLESADFTDRTSELRRKQQEQIHIGETIVPQKAKSNLLERIAAYFHIYNLWPQHNDTAKQQQLEHISKLLKPQLKRMQTVNTFSPATQTRHQHQQQQLQKPILVRGPLPYHYPIPLRPLPNNRLTQGSHGLPLPPLRDNTPVHLNTPKFFVPPHIQLARMTNIPPHHLQKLIQSKPKLAELAAKVSRFSVATNSDNDVRMDAQLMAAVRRAIEQDEDLKKLLQTTAASLL